MNCLVIIPTYNEKGNISPIIEQILSIDPIINVLVIDDTLPDGTGKIVDNISAKNPRVNAIHRPGKMGLGTAYVTGFKWALEHQYDLICEMDADFSHPPKTLTVFLEKIEGIRPGDRLPLPERGERGQLSPSRGCCCPTLPISMPGLLPGCRCGT